MPRFMPTPKLAVPPVSEPSAPILIGAPPAPWVACSAHETVPAAAGAAAGLAAAAGAAVAAAAGAVVAAAAAAGAVVAAAAGAVVAAAAAAGAVVGLAAAAGAVVGDGAAAGEQAASVSANALRMATGAWRPCAAANIASSPPQPRKWGGILGVTLSRHLSDAS